MTFKHIMILGALLCCSALSAQTMAEKLFLTIPSSANESVGIVDVSQFNGTPSALREVLDFLGADDVLENLGLDNSEVAGLSMSKEKQGHRGAKFCTIILKDRQGESTLNNLEKRLQSRDKRFQRDGMTLSVGQEKVYSVLAPDTITYSKIERGMKLLRTDREKNSMLPSKLKDGETPAMYYKKIDTDAQWSITILRQQDVFFIKAAYKTA